MNNTNKSHVGTGVAFGFATGAVAGIIAGIITGDLALWLSLLIGSCMALGAAAGLMVDNLRKQP